MTGHRSCVKTKKRAPVKGYMKNISGNAVVGIESLSASSFSLPETEQLHGGALNIQLNRLHSSPFKM